jgi:hypothetical protein
MRLRRSAPRVEPLEARDLPRSPFEAPSLGPPPAPGPDVVWVGTEPELQAAVDGLQSGQTVVVRPGTYNLTRPLVLGKHGQVQNVTVRGATDDFNDVVIRGAGIDNPAVPFGISVYDAQDVTIADLSVGEVWYHAIDIQGIQGAERVHLYHNRLYDAGEQIIKASSGGGGADDCVLEYNLVEFTAGPSVVDHGGGTGYTGGLHAHETDRWVIRDNLWRNVHTPDWVQHTFAPTILMWNHSADTVVEGNTFVDCDRAVAFGLWVPPDGPFDHTGGVIRNNFVYQRPGLFSAARRADSDGQLLAYDSPGTVIAHNTVLTNGNSRFSLEVRWANAEFRNNLTDAPYRGRDNGTFAESGNVATAAPDLFFAPGSVDLRLLDTPLTRLLVIDRADPAFGAATDWRGIPRPAGGGFDVGASEFTTAPVSPLPGPSPVPAPNPDPGPVVGPTPPVVTTPVGVPLFAAGADEGSGAVRLYNPDGSVRLSATPFGAGFAGGVRVAVADFNADGTPDLVAGTGPGRATEVRILDGNTGAVLAAFAPFEPAFTGGVYLAAGDLDGDGRAELVVSPDRGGGPRVQVYGGAGLAKVADFFGIDDPAFRGGARVAVGDLDGDGAADLVVSAGFQGGPRVAGYAGRSVLAGSPTRLFNDFFAFEPTLRNGAFLAVGDVSGDGKADLIAGGGPGGGPRVTAFDAAGLLAGGPVVLADFFAGDPANRGGVRLTAKDLDGDAKADLVAGAGTGAGSAVTVYRGRDLAGGAPPALLGWDAFAGFAGGVFVG